MKRTAVIVILSLLAAFVFSACAPAAPSGQTPEFLNDIGKTLIELKNEHPEGEIIESLDSSPDCAAICFGEPEAEYAYYFFGTQSGDSEKAMSECEEQLKCAGFVTTANILFPDMEDDMSFEDFFSLIGVDDYEYFGEDTLAAGWLRFMYQDMEVMVNTNEITPRGGWDFTGAEIVKRDAPVSIADPEILNTNSDLAGAVMFDETILLEHIAATGMCISFPRDCRIIHPPVCRLISRIPHKCYIQQGNNSMIS
ncbi:MAG: hypothetical protein ACLUKH_04575 [Flavonifractor plautii]